MRFFNTIKIAMYAAPRKAQKGTASHAGGLTRISGTFIGLDWIGLDWIGSSLFDHAVNGLKAFDARLFSCKLLGSFEDGVCGMAKPGNLKFET